MKNNIDYIQVGNRLYYIPENDKDIRNTSVSSKYVFIKCNIIKYKIFPHGFYIETNYYVKEKIFVNFRYIDEIHYKCEDSER